MPPDATNRIALEVGPELIGADTLAPEPVRWLWPGWLAAGKLHVLAGPPGVGKTTAALALAAAVSSGGELPDGSRVSPGLVVIWSGEDDPADTLVPRLLANGADRSRVRFVGGNGDGGAFDPAADMAALQQKLADLPNRPALLLLDPLVSAVAGDSHKNAEVRRALQPIADLARETGCAVLGITHYTKGTKGQDPVERVCGSIAFGAVARIVLGCAKLADDNLDGPGRVLVRAKSNLGEDSGGYRFDLEQVPVPGHPLIEASQVTWKGAMAGTARDILATAEASMDPEERTAVDDAADWLRGTVPPGGMRAAELFNAAKVAGLSQRTLQRAKARAGIRVERRGFAGGSWWVPSAPSTPAQAHTENLGANGDLGANGAVTGFQPGTGGLDSHSRQRAKVDADAGADADPWAWSRDDGAEAAEERAAILEFEAGTSRAEAQTRAGPR